MRGERTPNHPGRRLGRREPDRGGPRRSRRATLIATALLLGATWALAVEATSANTFAIQRRCPGIAATALPSGQKMVEELAIDISSSTQTGSLHGQYAMAAAAVVERAAAERGALRIVAFGASGVGARVVFAGSFAPVSADELYNLAAANVARCWAKVVIDRALAPPRRWNGGGSDVSGTLSTLIADGRSLVKRGGALTVSLLTDGCQAPAQSGPNSLLTDVCGKLARGVSPARIVHDHPAEFALADAHGVRVVMRGVGVGGEAQVANTLRAERLIEFWVGVCRAAHAAACEIGSSVL